uniref:Four helix bundle protein n=1 Tax=Schlesneria paludicola TaxID=360056 RepID=A0A7C2NYY7_9PLAN
MRNYRELIVWQKAHELTLAAYRLSQRFPGDERFGLTCQLRDAMKSVPANIAEGCGRDSDREFVRFLRIAAGSASEADYHLLLARDLGYLDEDAFNACTATLDEVRRMLTALIKRFRDSH